MEYRIKALLSAVLISLGLSACSGSGGSSSEATAPQGNSSSDGAQGEQQAPEEEPFSGTLVNGRVADGYLVGAIVCLDLNANKQCDQDEPRATSTAGGEYELEVEEGVNAGDFSVVVEVPATAIDEDTNEQVGGEYVMTAPAGKPEFVSPITTIVQTQIESNPGMTADEAEASVKSQLGYDPEDDIDLFEDYVEAQNDEENQDAEQYQRIHKIAQVAARALEENLGSLESAIENTDMQLDDVKNELVRLVVKEVIQQLSSISSAVDQAGENFDADQVSDGVAIAVDSSNIEDDVRSESALGDAVVTATIDLIQGGVNMLDDDDEYEHSDISAGFYGYSRIGVNIAASSLEQVFYEYDHDLEMFNRSGVFNSIHIALSENGWIMDASVGYDLQIDDDGSAIVESPLEGRFRVFGSSVDISDRNIASFLGGGEHEHWAEAIAADASFSANAAAYRWTFTQLSPLFRLDYYEGDASGVCFVNPAGVSWTLEQAGGNCNMVWSPNSDSPAQTLNELLVDPSAVDFIPVLWLDEHVGLQMLGELADGSGEVRFVSPTGETLSSGEWEHLTRGAVSLIAVSMPGGLRGSLRDDQASKLIFAVHQGMVRRGVFIAAGTVDVENEWNFNDVAMRDILSAFNPAAADSSEAGGSESHSDESGGQDDGSSEPGTDPTEGGDGTTAGDS